MIQQYSDDGGGSSSSTPKTILFVDSADGLGGAEQSLLLLLEHLDREGWHPHLACAATPLAERVAALGVPVHIIAMPRLRRSVSLAADLMKGALALARLARRVGALLLHANTVRSAFYTALAAHLARRPFVWHMRDFWLSEDRPRRLWADHLGKRLLCAVAKRVITNSHAVGRHLPCPARVGVVHNGIPVERFDPTMDGSAFRSQYGIPIQAPLVGMVGRLRPWKGQERFLRVAGHVRHLAPETRFVVVGGDPFLVEDGYSQRLQEIAREAALDGSVVFTDHLGDVRPALAAIDVFVHPGDPEPFGLVNVEAMAMGKPVVALAHGALIEIVAPGETGILVPPANETALTEAIVSLLHDPVRRRQLGRAGRARVESKFTAARMAREVASELDRVLAPVSTGGT